MVKRSKKTWHCGTCVGADTFDTRRKLLAHQKTCCEMQVDDPPRSRRRRPCIPKAVKYALWNSTYGERTAVGPCKCCGREVTQQSFEAGHVVPWIRGGSDSVANLRVVCRMCNASMGQTHLAEFKDRYFFAASLKPTQTNHQTGTLSTDP